MTTRRGFLAAGGRVVAGVAVGATVAADLYAADRGVLASGRGRAYDAWGQWESGPASPLRMVRAGVLAANAHNAQAWRFAITPARIDVLEDTRRGLRTIDPYGREAQLSLGCAIKNIVLAARAAGFTPTVTPSPAPDVVTGAVARIDLVRDGTDGRESTDRAALYRAIPTRHTDRAAYRTDRRLVAGIGTGMDSLVDDPDVRIHWVLTRPAMARFSDLTIAATEDFLADPQQSADDFEWYRGTREQIEHHRDGITAAAAGLSPLLRSLGSMVPATAASNGEYWLTGTRDRQLPTAAGFGIVVARDSADLAQRLAAGRLYQRLHLWATTQGVSLQPLNQAVERAERERSTTGPAQISHGLDGVVADSSWQPVMPFRLGYPTSTAGASPRRAVADVVTA